MNFGGLDGLTLILLFVFAVVTPLLGRADMRKLKQALARGERDARMDLYTRAIQFEWGMALLLAAAVWFQGRNLREFGLEVGFGGWEIFWSVVALAITAAVAWQSLRAAGDPAQIESLRPQLGHVRDVAPHTGKELRRFGWVSLSAGICEEFLYRGVLMGSLTAALGIWPAILLSSFVFGLGHSYQGPAGILRTGLVGLVLALIVALTGSLLVAMIAHVVFDLAQGRLLHAAVAEPWIDENPLSDAA